MGVCGSEISSYRYLKLSTSEARVCDRCRHGASGSLREVNNGEGRHSYEHCGSWSASAKVIATLRCRCGHRHEEEPV